MKPNKESRARRKRDGQRGQVIVLVPIILVALLGAAAFGIDMGNLYTCQQELNAATQASALAGAAAITSPTLTATTVATQYSAVTGNLNAHANLQNAAMVSGYPKLSCLTSTGLPACFAPASSPASAAVNAITVQEQATVNFFFARAFGMKSMTIMATATAVAAGGTYGTYKPYNIMLILDTTSSMTTNDADCGNITQEACALGGVRTLLGELDPCPTTLATCPSPNTKPVDEFGLFVFPGLCSSTNAGVTTANCPNDTTYSNPPVANSTYASYDYDCSPTNPPISSYNNDPAYLVLPLQSDYRTSDTNAALNTASNIVIAAGGGCSAGVQAPGGKGTFYAGAIIAAQNYLAANTRANVQNVMILLSDGDATATASDLAGTATSYPASNECKQAVTAAATAKTAGTLIYSVSYGSETTGCNTVAESPATTPCATMQNIASLPNGTTAAPSQYFFSQAPSGTGVTVCTGARASSSLSQAFQIIAGDLTVARVVPNGTT
jgi:hypothetical protein